MNVDKVQKVQTENTPRMSQLLVPSYSVNITSSAALAGTISVTEDGGEKLFKKIIFLINTLPQGSHQDRYH